MPAVSTGGMTHDELPARDLRAESEIPHRSGRREFLLLGAASGATLLAGCAAEPGSGDDGGTPSASDGTTAAGTFRLLISDQPVAIGDFDELNVSFDRARIFRGDGDDDAEGNATDAAAGTETTTDTADGNETATATPAATATPTPTDADAEADDDPEAGEDDEDDDSEDGDEDRRGFFVVDLDGETVDLTQVVGDKAVSVFDGELPEGRYAKIELYAAGVEGIVDGEPVDVKIPSGKLQITRSFEVVADETLAFVFDINVVKKGQGGEYNLLPVISESGVAGRDVDVEEVGRGTADSDEGETEDAGTGEDEDDAEGGDERGDDERDGQPDDAGGDP